MALITSAASGNFNAGATWTGGVVPTTGDEARASTGHTVTINVNTTCDEISNAGTGKFVINDGITLTANVTHKGTTASINLLEFPSASPASASIVGNCTGGSATSALGVSNLSSGTLSITGNCIGGIGTNAGGVNNSSFGIINITGNCEAGSGGGAQGAHGVRNSATGFVAITGDCKGASGTGTGSGAANDSSGTLSVIGTIEATQQTGGVSGASNQQATVLSGPFLTETVRGVAPVYCRAWRWNASPSNSTYMEVMTNDLLVKRNLVTADNITGMPAAADVKDGITYGPSSELTGTFSPTVSPSTSDIATAVWGAATRSITGGTVDTLANAPSVPSAATIASQVRTELGTELGRIDAAVSSRLAPSGTLATVTTLTNAPSVPSASTIASQVRTELTTELARIDAAITTRAATGTLATDLTAIRAKTDALVTDRLAQCSTVATTGAQLAAALS